MRTTVLASPAFWLIKSEPSDYSIDDMERDGTTAWDGVRSTHGRANLRRMCVGDKAFFYHSSAGAKSTGVVGVVDVVREAYPDPADAAWMCVDVRFDRRLPAVVTLKRLKEAAAAGGRWPALDDLVLLRQSRLSVQPLTAAQWQCILDFAKAEHDLASAGTAARTDGDEAKAPRGRKRKVRGSDAISREAPATVDTDDIIAALESLVKELVPKAAVVEKYGGRLFTLHPELKEGQFCGVFPYSAHVQLSFARGAELRDPHRLLQGTGKRRKHMTFVSTAQVKSTRSEIKAFIEQAVRLDAGKD